MNHPCYWMGNYAMAPYSVANLLLPPDHPPSQDPCLAYCHAYLCKATLTVCTEPLKDTALEDLVKGLFSEFYPQQLATFTLAKR